MKGINLGGWLVLEKWMTPSLFSAQNAVDEYTLCEVLGERAPSLMKRHRDSFIQQSDVKWLADNNFKLIRLPVGYWLFGGFEPYCATDEYVSRLLDWAELYGVKVLIDLHGAPGSQNGWDHSGRAGEANWHQDSDYIKQTLQIIRKIVETYGDHPAIWGIELLNEPIIDIPLRVLQDFYREAYKIVTNLSENLNVVIHNAFRPLVEWEEMLIDPALPRLLLDIHLYQLFDEKDRALDLQGHLDKTLKWKKMIQQFGPEKIVVGEWSVALDKTYEGLTGSEAERARLLYYQAQQFAFEGTVANCYWNYKTESYNDWNFKTLLPVK